MPGGAPPEKGAKGGAGSNDSVEDRINLHQLMELKAVFERADSDHGGTLDLDEFLKAFGGVLGENLSREKLVHLFMKIDANSDGSVDWDEFTNFMLLENQAAADMSDRSYQVRYVQMDPKMNPNPKSVLHKDMIEGILVLPTQEKIISSSRDGTVRSWSATTLAHQRTLKVSDSWVTHCHYMSRSNRLAAACIDRDISFFDVNTYELSGKLTGLDASPLCLGDWIDLGHEKLIVGDDLGQVSLYDMNEVGMDGHSWAANATRLYREHRHTDWVTKVCFYDELNLMVTSSLDGTLKIGELDRKAKSCRQLGESSAKSGYKKGIYDFDWSNNFKVLASCGLERTISLWNPYTRNTGKPLAQLQGHCASVHHVTINDSNYHLISCSVDKVIKVWDMRTYKCLQTIHDKTQFRPENRISSLTYDPTRSQLLVGTSALTAWPMVKVAKRPIEQGHEFPLCAALYNQNFHQVVSGDESAHVCVWDVEKGDLVFTFSDLHSAKMTAMTFDEAGRRLITGGNDGTVRVWNFSNGQLLKELKTETNLEVSSILFILDGQNKLIVAGGWNRKVLVWRDESGASTAPVEPDRRMPGHNEDIISIAFSAPNLLATSGYDGNVLVWNMDSCVVKFNLCIPEANALQVDQRAIWKLLFLDKLNQALCGACADGYIRFWNVKEGALVWQQHGGNQADESIVALATDPSNSFLYTGDTAGFLKVWDIHQFLNSAGLDQSGRVIELHHWQAHEGCIATLDYIVKYSMLLSASADTKVKLWSITPEGAMLTGILGNWSPWSLSDPSTFRAVENEHHRKARLAQQSLPPPPPPPRAGRARRALAAASLSEKGEEDDGEEGEEGSFPLAEDDDGEEGSFPPLPEEGGEESVATPAGPDPFELLPTVPPTKFTKEDLTLSTKDSISQILSRNANKDPLRKFGPAAESTMHRLRVHNLNDVMLPKSQHNTPR